MSEAFIKGPDWECVTPEAGWQPRDSQGEFVYDDHLWVLGGWFTPQTPNPCDVWKSPNGKDWTCTTEKAPWEHSDLSVSLVFNERMWFMGGRKLPGTDMSNKVWSSTDGADWTLEGEAGWSPRIPSGFVVFKDRMWVMGGTSDFYVNDDETLFNDVWSTADGKDWKLELDHAPWEKRAHHQAVVFDDKIWIMGGGKWNPVNVPLNDVWCSEDGVNWTQATDAAPWQARIWFSLVVYRDHMWVLAGWAREHGNYGDVWFSKDGANWTELKSNVKWKNRHEPSAYVFQDKIFLAAGLADVLVSEVWSLELPEDWGG